MASTGGLQTIYGGILGIGKPSEYELMCRHWARLYEGLIPFVALFEGSEHGRSNDNSRNHRGPVAQMVERLPCKQGVDGSIPVQDLQIKKKRPRPEYDWRVVVARDKEKERLCRQ